MFGLFVPEVPSYVRHEWSEPLVDNKTVCARSIFRSNDSDDLSVSFVVFPLNYAIYSVDNRVMGPATFGMNTKYSIDKLNGDNYLVWATQVQLVLESKGLWKYVADVMEVDADGTTSEASGPSSNIQREQEARQAMAEIILNIESKYVVSVLNKKTPREVWNTLKDMNSSQARASQTTLRRKLLCLKKKETQTIQEYANVIADIENQLAASEFLLSEFDKKFALLQGLPQEYDTIRTYLREKDTDTFAQLVAKLEIREEELRNNIEVSEKNGKQPKAFLSGGKTDKKKRVKCYHCKKRGHMKKDCFYNPDSPKYKPHLAMNDGNSAGERVKDEQANLVMMANVVTINAGNTRVRSTVPFHKKWFVDSCASQHMCRDIRQFNNIRKLEEPKSIDTAEEGNGLPSRYVGTVNIVSKIDGREVHILLKDVAYVPTIRTNLMSIPTMQRKWFGNSFSRFNGPRGYFA